MTRHNTTDKKAKARRLKAEKPEHRAAPAASSRRPSPDTDFQVQLEQKTRELAEARKLLAEALEQQTATSEVLKVISSSPGELEPVFQSILTNATRICGAKFANLVLYENGVFRDIALYGAPPTFAELRKRNSVIMAGPSSSLAQALETKRVVHVADLAASPAYTIHRDPAPVELVEVAGARTLLVVPMLKECELIGAIGIYRQEVRPFTERQIELVQNFAAQAVIAIENTRLLNELRQRTDDLTESLEQQTATSEVLKVISSSPGNLQPVFEAMLQNAIRICGAKFGLLFDYNEQGMLPVAWSDLPAAFEEHLRQRGRRKPQPGSDLDLLITSKRLVHTADMLVSHALIPPAVLGGARTELQVPMLKDNELVGAISIYRQQVQPFADRQIELLQNFAAQAVIAIENTRLLNDLRESLQQQTATADVLGVISRSTFDLQAVLDTLAESAVQLCAADRSVIRRRVGDTYPVAATYGFSSEQRVYRDQSPTTPDTGSVHGRALVEGRTVHIPDVLADPAYRQAEAALGATAVRAGVGVPLMREGNVIGVLTVIRNEARAFSQKQIELLETFADQAVIAIENVRLFEAEQQRTRELTESLEQQTATSEVLKVISSSPGELKPVFDTLLTNATRMCGAKFGAISLREGDQFRAFNTIGAPAPFAERIQRDPIIRITPGHNLERLVSTKAVVHIPNLEHDEAPLPYELAGARAALNVPLLKDGELIGSLLIYRQEQGPFSDKQIELVQNFAAQAVIAIENTRLLNELRHRTDDLSESLEQQTATSEVLKVISSSPGKLQPVFESMLANAVRICGAKFGVTSLREGDGFRVIATHQAPAALVEARRRNPLIQPTPGHNLDRLLRTKDVVHVPDLSSDPKAAPTLAKFGGAKALLNVPLLKDGELIGSIVIFRQEAAPFGNKQIELVQNFAAQAVIAIENARLLNELHQSLERQTATSEVLSIISRSRGELAPVFEAMLANASRICEASFGSMMLYEDEMFRRVALHNPPPKYAEFNETSPLLDRRKVPSLDRLVETKQPVQIADMQVDEPDSPICRLGGARTLLTVPMLKAGEPIGAIGIYRQEVRLFADKQIELVSNFAAQAVIAIENTRLLNELRQRTDDLTEALEQQTATSEVLQVISSSPGNLQPVFESVLENATDICGAGFGMLWLTEGDGLRPVATHGVPSVLAEERSYEGVLRFGPDVPLGRVVITKQLAHVADIREEPGYVNGFRPFVRLADVGGARTLLVVPMLKESELVGAIAIYRQEVRTFTDKQIALVQNFANQAVIAIENARLLNELRESLQQQTATADVLKVISSSPGDLQPVFNTMLDSATRICEAKFAMLYLYEHDAYRPVAMHNAPAAYAKEREADVLYRPPPDLPLGRILATKRAAQIADARATQSYVEGNRFVQAGVDLGGFRTVLAVPVLKDDELIGAIAIYRQEVRPFTDKQVELVSNFAAQAVIAIENTRLLNELRESLQQQTATADVLKVISRSTFDLQTVLNTLVGSAARLAEADMTAIARPRDGKYHVAASYGFPPGFGEYMATVPMQEGRQSLGGRVLLERRPVQIVDILADPEYTFREPQRRGNYRTGVAVPLLREGVPIGILFLFRATVKPFTEQQIALATTFADQAVIAIENVRLFESVEARTRELAQSLDNLQTAQDRLVQTQKLASLGQLTAGIAHEIKNPLNFVNNFSALSSEMLDELQETLQRVQSDEKTRAEIDDLTDTLRANLDKIEQHGKRADSIVKNMLLHSREGSGEHRPIDINAVVEESLNLAYHGARAEKQGFNITLERSFDPAAGEVDVFPQEITRVLLNLISNGFYAATKRKGEMGDGGYDPTLAATTKSLGDRVEIRIRDNGTGIPPEVKDKMFNPFFTTKPAGEGTGLGLSLSHDIIVKQHAGSIEVDTEPGEFTEFRIILPRAAATIAKSGDGREPSHSRG
jgi:GAF domain-containing protein